VGAVLVVNAGSSSLKLHVVGDDDTAAPVDDLSSVAPEELDGVGHRIVHGGAELRGPAVIDAAVEEAIRAAIPIAPLHNAPALEGLDRARAHLPTLPHVAVFDTAFHATLPDVAATYAVPERWREEWGIRRYGFHGLSAQWASERTGARRLVVCHLGGGCSVTAVLDGRSVDTTMGFSPLDGVPMATRSGSVDPGALLYLLREHGVTVDELADALERHAGLAGLSGGSGDMQDLLEREAAGDEAAHLAVRVFAYRVGLAVASMAAALGGIDALVFTAGIGEGSPVIRERICRRLAHLGVDLDERANRLAGPDADIGSKRSTARVVVVRSREEIVVARAVREVLRASDPVDGKAA
jgi:acetate kinase